jgi:hypothetical protein
LLTVVTGHGRVGFTEPELRELYEQKELSSRAIAQLRGCQKSTVLSAMVTLGIPRRPPRSEPIYPRQSFSGDPIEKAYLIGFRDGDLHVHKANHHETSRTIVIACATTKDEQIELIRSLFEPYGRLNVSSTPRQSVITYWVDLSFSFLLAKSERVPRWALENKQCFAAYLAGYVDAEGAIGVKRATKASQLVIRSGDVGILRSCQAKLAQLGVDCPPISLVKSAGGRDGVAGPIYHRDHWCLGVYRQDALNKLFEMISPFMRHAKRRQDMEIAWHNLRSRSLWSVNH